MKSRYEHLWRNKFLTVEAKTIDNFIAIYEELASMFRDWKELGIELDPDSGIDDDYAVFVTSDEEIAQREGFELATWGNGD